MFKKLCLLITSIAVLLTVGIYIKQHNSSVVKFSDVSSEKWDKDRATRLPDNNLHGDDFLSSENNSNRIKNEPAIGEKLDFKQLDKLDGSLNSWWIKLNKNHEPTTIPVNASEMLKKYNGIYQGDTSKKEVYLTFDEGYENGYTSSILDTLKANDVKAIFFVTGPYIKTSGKLIIRMLSEGHQVGNHTINHLSLPKLSDAKLEHELYGLEKNFNALTGMGFKYMRPPSGEYSEKVLSAANQLKYKTVFWSYAYMDFDTNNQKGPDFAYRMVMNNIHNGAVILLHAVSKDNSEALDRIIKGIKEEGYTIKPFDL